MQASIGSILLAAGLTLASATIGYAIYFDYKRRNDLSFRKKVKKDMKFIEKMTTETVSEPELSYDDPADDHAHSSSHSHSSKLPQFDASNIDITLEQILMRPGPEREKIFYGLLIKGEELVNSPKKQEVDQGIQYFYKALCLLPNPTELLNILQNTIPPAIFKQLLQLISETSMKRIITYFQSIIPEGAAIQIRPIEINVSGKEIPVFSVFAAKDFQEGQVICNEAPLISVSPYLTGSGHCDNCYSMLKDENDAFSCKSCHTKYCGELCMKAALETYHQLLCPSEAHIEELLDYSKSHPYILLIARYMSVVFSEQLKAVKAISQGSTYDPTNSIVSHFEYMRYYGQGISSVDEKEASIIRRVFSPNVKELEDTLSTERYAAVKYRILSTCIPFSLSASDKSLSLHSINISDGQEHAKHEEPLLDSGLCMALFKCSGHIGQSETPNLTISPERGSISLVASKKISKGEELTFGYFPMHGILANERCKKN